MENDEENKNVKTDENNLNLESNDVQEENLNLKSNTNINDSRNEKYQIKPIFLYIGSIIIIIIILFISLILKLLYNEKEKNRKFNYLVDYIDFVKKNRNTNQYEINKEINDLFLSINNNESIQENKDMKDINVPFLPITNKEYIVKEYNKTYYNSSHIRYHFHDLFNKRKLFKINYSYLPYKEIDKSIPYDQTADKIYESTGMINITQLDFYYNNIDIDTSNFNHIHLSMGFNKDYILLSSIAIASILNTSNPNTYVHFHIILNDCKYEDIKPIIALKKINKNVEFVFYNGKQAEYDFGERGKREWRGVGDYSRILLPEIVNNTNKILIIDSGDTITQKDLSEVYFFDLEDNYFTFSLEDIAGRTDNSNLFGRNNFYPNTGICLVNVREFRKDHLYRTAFYSALAYYDLPCPYQDIFLMISNYKFKFMPLSFNCPQFFENDEQMENKSCNTSAINHWLDFQQKSPYKYSREELLESALDPVIIHLTANKPNKNMANKKYTLMWIEYAKITGLYEEIKKKYPDPFKKYNIE